MALIKWKKSNTEWVSLYADMLKNRLRRDMNLGDVNNRSEARKNLGLSGEVEDHWHDEFYTTIKDFDAKLNSLFSKINEKLNSIMGDSFNKLKDYAQKKTKDISDDVAKQNADLDAMEKELDEIERIIDNVFDDKNRLVYPNGNLLWIKV